MTTQISPRERMAVTAAESGRRFPWAIWVLLPLLAAISFAPAADAAVERRVALVIGNSAYRFTPHLPNPTNDADGVAAALQRLGFEVSKGIDLDRMETELIIREFARKLPGADVALFFYAGHGMQVARQNYLIPVDAQLADETDLHFEATDLNLVLGLMEREPRVNLVFLDACRDNPLSQKLARSMGATRSAAVGRGLALVDAQAGSMVVYATEPDKVALDGDGTNSPFTAALLKHMETPGLSISDMMIRVRSDVKASTHGQQVPREDSSLTSSFYFQPAAAVAAVEPPAASAGPAAAPAAASVDKEVVFWDSIKDSASAAPFEAYLAQFPDGTFTSLARLRLQELTAKPDAADRQLAALPPAASAAPTPEQVEQDIGLTRRGRSRVQLALTLLGHNTGGSDGVFGPKSRAAISAWQAARGDASTGYLTAAQHAALLDAAAPQLTAWDAQQRNKAEQAKQAAAKAQPQDSYRSYSATSAQGTGAKDTAARAELERQKQENEELKKALAAKQAEKKSSVGVNLGVGLGTGGVGIFPSLSLFD